MQTASMNFAIENATASINIHALPSARLVSGLPSFVAAVLVWAANRFILPKLRKAESVMVSACGTLKISIIEIQQDAEPELIDQNMLVRNAIDNAKSCIREQQEEFLKLLKALDQFGDLFGDFGDNFTKEIKFILALFNESYHVLNQLSWAISEHNADREKRMDGFTASSKEEVDRLLDKIANT